MNYRIQELKQIDELSPANNSNKLNPLIPGGMKKVADT